MGHFKRQELAPEIGRHGFEHFFEFPGLRVIRAVHLFREKIDFEHPHNRRTLSTVFFKGESPFLTLCLSDDNFPSFKMTTLQEVATPAKAGVQVCLLFLDSGACPGPDPGFAGMTEHSFQGFSENT